MFGIIAVTSVLECLIFMPVSFTVFRFFLPPNLALLLSAVLCLISLLACWLCRLKLEVFVYKIISVVVSILLAFIIAQVSVGTILIAATFIFVFMRVKSEIDSGRDIAIQISAVAILLNIPLALINVSTISQVSKGYINAAIFISTIATVILLILKQVDDSRRFGQNNMDISTTQRKNNKIFAGVVLVLLLAISSIGQVSNIYSLVINVFVNFLEIPANFFTPKTGEMQQSAEQMQDIFGKAEAKDQSTFEMIIQAILSVLSVIIIVVLIGFVIYLIAKLIIKLVRRIINWFKNGEQAVLRLSEDGHTDERLSLYNRNFRNMAKRLHDMATGLFDREIPYKKLPNDIAKMCRLFKYYKNNAQLSGVKISNSSTAQEICHKVADISPETEQFNNLLLKCYDAARYDDSAPSPQELLQLESKLLK